MHNKNLETNHIKNMDTGNTLEIPIVEKTNKQGFLILLNKYRKGKFLPKKISVGLHPRLLKIISPCTHPLRPLTDNE